MNHLFIKTVFDALKKTQKYPVSEAVDFQILATAHNFAAKQKSHRRHVRQFIYAIGAMAACVAVISIMLFSRHSDDSFCWNSDLSSKLNELKMDLELSAGEITVSNSNEEEIKKLFSGE